MSKDIKEEKIASASYVLGFFQDVAQLTQTFSNYANLLLELETQQEAAKLNIESQDALRQYCNVLRYYVRNCYIKYAAIMHGTKQQANNRITELHNSLVNKFIVHRKEAQEYVELLNNVLVDNVMKNLLETSQELVDQLYKNE